MHPIRDLRWERNYKRMGRMVLDIRWERNYMRMERMVLGPPTIRYLIYFAKRHKFLKHYGL